jgi:hypothetical protein
MASLTNDFDIAWDIAGLSLVQRFISIRQHHAGGEGDKNENDCWVEHVYSSIPGVPSLRAAGVWRRSNPTTGKPSYSLLDCFPATINRDDVVGRKAPSSQ